MVNTCDDDDDVQLAAPWSRIRWIFRGSTRSTRVVEICLLHYCWPGCINTQLTSRWLIHSNIVPSSMLLLVSGINSRLPSINHALISPVPTHPVLWVALPPSVPSTHHSHHPSPHHSFIPGLKPSFSANPSLRSHPFFFTIAQTVYCYFWAYPFLTSVFLFYTF